MRNSVKRRVFVLMMAIVFLLSGCGLVQEAAVEVVRDSMGDEYADAYEAEYNAAMEELEQEWNQLDEALRAEMQDEYEAMKAQLKEQWDAKKESLKEEAQSAIQEELGEQGEAAQELLDTGMEWIDSLFGPKWEYPVVNPKCSWRGFEEETWSWSEWEFTDPEGQGREYHLALDLQSEDGSLDILAAADGTVVFGRDSAQKTSGNGYKVVIEHELDGVKVYSFYAHLASVDDMPTVGTEVKQGDRIGTMGTTGTSSKKNPHLHFAVYKANQRYDPHGRAQKFTGNVKEYSGYVFYNPKYIIENDKLPE